MESSHVSQPKPLSESPSDEMARRLHESSLLRTIFVFRGVVTNPSDYHDRNKFPSPGELEYRFTEDSTGDPSSPMDRYLSLEDGLAAHDGCIIRMMGDAADTTLYDRWEQYVNGRVHRMNGYPELLAAVRDAAYEQGLLGSLLDALDQRR